MRNMAIHDKTNFTQWYDHALILLLAILFVLLPSINSNELMQGTMSGKMFFFLYAVLVCGLLSSLKFIVKTYDSMAFSVVDGALLLWIGYILINGWSQQIPMSNRFLELLGLILLYILLRQIKPSRYGILLLAIVFGATIQAIIGNLQLWGYTPSRHALFKMTGSFFNPGPFAGFLVSVFPVILGVIILKKNLLPMVGVNVNQAVAWIGGLLILLALVASDSRAAYIAIVSSSIMLLFKQYPVGQWLRKHTPVKRNLLLVAVLLLVSAALFGIIKMKSDSTNGRILIWKVTSGMVADHPLTGIGFDRFKSYYMDRQAEYFRAKPDSPEAMLAGDTNYCFNEFLQHTVENGLIGFLMMLGVLACVFVATSRQYEDELWIAKAGIVGIAVFAMFSYPAQILPIKIILVVYLAYIATLTEKQGVWCPQKIRYILKGTLAIFMVISAITIIRLLPIYQETWKSWNSAHQLSQSGSYEESLRENEKALHMLKYNGDFLTFYGKNLALAGKYELAVEILHQAALYYPNIISYTTLGDSYKALGKVEEAEQAYLWAWYMNPSRFYPKYLLAKLYDETGQAEKAMGVARELLEKEVKVQSTAIDEIESEMKTILNKKTKNEDGIHQ